MTKAGPRPLTELEGAVLTEIGHRGNRTAFKVRRAFELSPCAGWSGSSGAVYPAINRLIKGGAILAEPVATGRGTKLLSLSPLGKKMLEAWSCDAATACAIAFDPFRLRSGLWKALPVGRRRQVIATMKQAVRAQMEKLEGRGELDLVEQTENDLAMQVQMLRLQWLDALDAAS